MGMTLDLPLNKEALSLYELSKKSDLTVNLVIKEIYKVVNEIKNWSNFWRKKFRT